MACTGFSSSNSRFNSSRYLIDHFELALKISFATLYSGNEKEDGIIDIEFSRVRNKDAVHENVEFEVIKRSAHRRTACTKCWSGLFMNLIS